MIPYQQQQLGDAGDFLARQGPIAAGVMVVGGALLTGALLSGFGVWLYRKAGAKTGGKSKTAPARSYSRSRPSASIRPAFEDAEW